MKKRKRAPGGGRKPGGDFSNLTVPFSVRMPQSMRDELKRAARKRGRKEGQELLSRLQRSFAREREEARDPAMRAMCYLFSQLAEAVHMNAPAPDWRSDPFLFRAIKLGIIKLLDALEPKGEPKLPRFWAVFADADIPGFPFTAEERKKITQSPEALAEYQASKLLADFASPQPRHKGWEGWQDSALGRDPFARQVVTRIMSDFENTYYGMEQARRDLKIKSGGKP